MTKYDAIGAQMKRPDRAASTAPAGTRPRPREVTIVINTVFPVTRV